MCSQNENLSIQIQVISHQLGEMKKVQMCSWTTASGWDEERSQKR